jgi:hypothetical protein
VTIEDLHVLLINKPFSNQKEAETERGSSNTDITFSSMLFGKRRTKVPAAETKSAFASEVRAQYKMNV